MDEPSSELENPDVVLEALRTPLISAGCLVRVISCSGIVLLALALLFPPIRPLGPPPMELQSRNNLKQIGLAMRNYHDDYDSFPPAYTVDPAGRRLHSWRTLLLPYLGQSKLYESIDLNKPWDDPANRHVSVQTMPFVFQCSFAGIPDRTTTFLAVVSPDGCFSGATPHKRSEITDGPSITLLIIEASSDKAVPWMSPADADEAWLLQVSPKHMFQVLYADGIVQPVQLSLTTKDRRALISIAGGD